MADPRDEELGNELRALAAWLETPEPPDVRAVVRSRLTARRPVLRRWPLSRRWLAVALATAIAVAIAVVPQGRAAVAHAVTGLLRFAGVEVRHDPSGRSMLPATPSPLPSIQSATLDEARRRARFPVGVPAELGVPEQVLLADAAPDGAPRVVSLLYRGGQIRLDEFDGELDPLFEKTGFGPEAQWVPLNGKAGLWFPTPHALVYIDREGVHHTETARLAGPCLIWRDGAVTYRLEGPSTLAEATAIAANVV